MKVLSVVDPAAEHARNRPLPAPDNVSGQYWAAAAGGQLLIQRCPSCGHCQFYPRAMCTECGSDVEWVEASGEGVIHTFTVIRQNLAPSFAGLGPYVVAIIELAEGPMMMSNVTHVAIEDVSVGLEVTCYAVKVEDDLGLPFWRPRGD